MKAPHTTNRRRLTMETFFLIFFCFFKDFFSKSKNFLSAVKGLKTIRNQFVSMAKMRRRSEASGLVNKTWKCEKKRSFCRWKQGKRFFVTLFLLLPLHPSASREKSPFIIRSMPDDFSHLLATKFSLFAPAAYAASRRKECERCK